MKTSYGLQLYSVRDAAAEDFKGTLERVARMGYKYVEFAGFFGYSAETVKEWLSELSLEVIATHTKLDELRPDKIDETVAYHKAIGCDKIIIPSAKWDDEAQYEDNMSVIFSAQKRLSEEGIELGFHNHSREFYKTPFGKVMMDELFEKTSLAFEIDIFWVFNAKVDPVEYLEAHKDRVTLIHLKDGISDRVTPADYGSWKNGARRMALGEGNAPIKEVREWAIRNRVPMVVESEGLEPTGPEEVERCMAYLRSLED